MYAIYYSKITHATMFYIISARIKKKLVRIKKKLAFFFPFEQTKCVCMKNLYKTGGRVSYFFKKNKRYYLIVTSYIYQKVITIDCKKIIYN